MAAAGVAWVVCAALAQAGCGSSSSKPSSARVTTRVSASSPAAGTRSTTGASDSSPAAGTPTGSGPLVNSCSAVSQAEAAAAIGHPVTRGVPGRATVEGGIACVFYGPSASRPRDPNVPQRDSVRVVVVRGSRASSWYDDYRSKVRAEPVSGYGDHAFYDGFASLSVLQGDEYVRIAVILPAGPPSLAGEEKLAGAILPRR